MREGGETTSSQEPMMVDEAQVRVATVGGSAQRNVFLHPRRRRLEHSAAFMIQPPPYLLMDGPWLASIILVA